MPNCSPTGACFAGWVLALAAYALLIGPLWTVLAALLAAAPFLVLVISASRAVYAVLGAGSGVAVLASVLGATPGVDPHRRVNPTDAGENNVALQITAGSTIVLVLPTLGMAVPLAFAPVPAWFPVATLVVALLNGGVLGWVLGRLAARRLTHQLPETFARLRYPGAQRTPGRYHRRIAKLRSTMDHTVNCG
ncbi:hypothetical protein [Bounagaea algeriensis]